MPSLEAYSKTSDYSYCLGYYPCMLLMENRPKSAFRLLISSEGQGDGLKALREKCAEAGVREETADKMLKRISGKQNCFAAIAFRKYSDELSKSKSHIVLNNISDAGNLGTCLRSAAGFGYGNVALIRPCADCFDPHVIRASMGAFFLLRIKVYDAFSDYAAEFNNRDMYPFMLDGAKELSSVAQNATRPHTLIFGNEAGGLDASFQKIGQSVKISQSDAIDSLNLSVAASIAMYEFSKYNNI